MKVSYKWLQEYFDKPLPKPEELGELLNFHSFELEGIERVGDDHMLDLDVLPNRSSDCLSHAGIAREIAALLDRKLKWDPLKGELKKYPKSKEFSVEIDEPELCPRFTLSVIEGVKVGPSPDWVQKSLETIGQKPINNIVDITNCIMFNFGQPVHAFDAEKLKGGKDKIIRVRSARNGEKITTLTGEESELDESNLLIVGGVSDKPIGIAGVKGGKFAEVDESTVDVAIEMAHFDPISIRKTSQKLKLWTDASTRFQNNPSPELISYAQNDCIASILEFAGGTLEGFVDVDMTKKEEKSVSVSVDQINRLLGTTLDAKEVSSILNRLEFSHTESGGMFTVTPPFYRTDINIYEDLVEEVGRIHGYEHLEAKALPDVKIEKEINKEFYYADRARNILTNFGFSEIYGYTFRDKGDFEAIESLASDKNCLRINLSEGIGEYLEKNHRNAPLLGLDRVKLFEIGRVFPKSGEHVALALGVSGKKADKFVLEAKEHLEKTLDIKLDGAVKNGILEINFSKLLEKLPEPKKYELFEKTIKQYETISQYPFVLRDLAIWVPEKTKAEEILEIVKNKSGNLLARTDVFDEFEKEGRKSFAFHLVYQSHEKTLSDDEVGKIMDNITDTLNKKEGFEVR